MALKDLREFLALIDGKGQLRRVAAEIDPVLEIGEVTDRVSKAFGPALVFEHPVDRESGRRYDIPVAINVFGTYDRMAWALGVDAQTGTWRDLDAVAQRVMDLLPLDLPASMKGKLDALMGLKDLAGAGAKEVKKAPCQEVVYRGEEVDLGMLPVLKTWPEDGGRFITLPLVVTADLKGKPNVGMYRLQIFDRNTTGMHIHEHHDGARNMREHFAAGNTRMPVSVALGTDPITIFSATAPVPPIIDEYLFAGILRGEPVEVVKCLTNDLMVPAHAEIVLEGYVEAG
ncbi:MAG TPA: UbiD family decarboxylase, partial [Coriobacteriia bacterium]